MECTPERLSKVNWSYCGVRRLRLHSTCSRLMLGPMTMQWCWSRGGRSSPRGTEEVAGRGSFSLRHTRFEVCVPHPEASPLAVGHPLPEGAGALSLLRTR